MYTRAIVRPCAIPYDSEEDQTLSTTQGARLEETVGLEFPTSPIPAVNVATVPQRSPLRYPGGKTWLIPHIRAWLETTRNEEPTVLHEPFAGGATASLTAVMENFVNRAVIGEIDEDLSAFWSVALNHTCELQQLIGEFELTEESVNDLVDRETETELDHAFRTLVMNRTRRGGILADGASSNKSGENGKGIASRWYPDTLIGRLQDISSHGSRITLHRGDGVEYINGINTDDAGERHILFIDPPYTAGSKKTGERLYRHSDVNHERLFDAIEASGLEFLLTYDRSAEIIRLINRFGYFAVNVSMKNTHHEHRDELVITRHNTF